MAGNQRAKPPGVVGEITKLIGAGVASKIVAARGGTRAYIPVNPGPDHWLTQLLGVEAAQRLAKYFAIASPSNPARLRGAVIDIPMCSTSAYAQLRAQVAATIDKGLEAGLPATSLSRRIGVTERSVRRHKARLREVQR